MTSLEVRKKFFEFFLKNQHYILPSSSLIPDNDPSLLFVNAGMNQFKDVFLGLKPLKDIFLFAGLNSPAEPNTATIQKCLRAGGKHNDLENVGETPFHHTFFEMLGNFSFGAYFKQRAIALAWEFLTKELKIPAEHLWVSVHKKDKESFEIWEQKQKIPPHKIFRLEDKDNFWQMGETGPCGFCSEIHYFKGKNPHIEQLTEIWNLVFMEFYDKENGEREKLAVPCVDTGMGLERLCSVLQNKKSNYHTDLFLEIILSLETASASKYDFEEKSQNEQQKAFRVLADHSRAICFLIADDVIPENEKEGYVLRRIIRRALYYSQKLHPKKNLLKIAVDKTLNLMNSTGAFFDQDKNLAPAGKAYLSLNGERTRIQSVIEGETKKFFDSLKEGKKQLEKIMKTQFKVQPVVSTSQKTKQQQKLKEPEVWNLYSTYGFPIDLTRLIAQEKGWTIAKDSEIKQYIKKIKEEKPAERQPKPLNKLYQKKVDPKSDRQKAVLQNQMKKEILHREINDFLIKHADSYIPSIKNKMNKTNFTGYETSKEIGKIVFIGSVQAEDHKAFQSYSGALTSGKEGWMVLDKSCFYPEGGGPVGDKGLIKTKTGQAEILDCQKKSDFIWHKIKVLKGELKEGQNGKIEVYKNYRKGIKSHHTATHLLNSALRRVLGDSVRQKGSLVEPYFLRFDFSHPQALAPKQIAEVEKQVLDHINQAEKAAPGYKSFEHAQKEGYIYLKGENYPNQVRVLTIGKDSSKELCGGVHVKNSSEIESFKIIKEEGIGSGVRRITAYAGFCLRAWEDFLIKQNLALREFLYQSDLSFPLSLRESWGSEDSSKLSHPVQSNDFKKVTENKAWFWKGDIEKENPFLQVLEHTEKELKALRKQIVKLDAEKTKPSAKLKKRELINVKKSFHPLAQQILELRDFLKLPLLKIKKTNDFTSVVFTEEKPQLSNNLSLDFFKNKQQDIQNLTNILREIQKRGLNLKNLDKQVKEFNIKNQKVRLLVLSLPLEDRKTLSDLSDFVLSQLNLSVLIVLGESQTDKHPLFVNLNKRFSSILSASHILKNDIAPIMNGRGGGKPHFAQGSVQDKTKLDKLDSFLIKKWS